MEIKYFQNRKMTEANKRDLDYINSTYLAGDPSDVDAVETDMYDWDAPEDGIFLLLDGDRAVGRVSVHKTQSIYDGQSYTLGGFGGLAVLPEYRGKTYGRQLAEAALDKANAIGIDVACMCVNMKSGITDFYIKLGYRFLNRPAYFLNWQNREKTDDTVMIMGVKNRELADKILHTQMKFSYGDCNGHW